VDEQRPQDSHRLPVLPDLLERLAVVASAVRLPRLYRGLCQERFVGLEE